MNRDSNTNVPTLVILAAGVGRRFGGLKQLEPVGPSGEALLEYSVFDALRAGFGRVVLVVREETEADFRERFESSMGRHVPIDYVHQTLEIPQDRGRVGAHRVKPWGTGHAVLAAEPVVQRSFAVVNADDFYGIESFQALSRFLAESRNRAPMHLALVSYEIGPTLSEAGSVSRAVCRVDSEGRLEALQEIVELRKRGDGGIYLDEAGREVLVPGDEPASMNCWALDPRIFAELRRQFERFVRTRGEDPSSEFYLPEAIQSLNLEDRARVEVLRCGRDWCGMTNPEDRARTASAIETMTVAGRYPRNLWSGDAASRA